MKNTSNTTNTTNAVNTIKTINIEPCTSTRTGDAVKNQYIIKCPGIYAFQSYDSLIAVYDIENNILTLGIDFDYSVTTSKYLNQFLYDYCYSIYRELPNGKSLKDSLYKAINNGLILYDAKMR